MNINIKDYQLIKIDDIKFKESANEIFYDIEVEDDNSFHIVTEDNKNLLVHNCDGFHIKGLLLNFFQHFWPELLNIDQGNNFLWEFITPIIIATYGKKRKMFYNINDYKKWIEQTENNHLYTIKYMKGLGTLGPVLGKELFKDLNKHLIPFHQTNEKETDDVIDLAFNKKRQNDRKDWLTNYQSDITFDKFGQKTTYESFMNNEFIEFSMADNIRSIPSVVDGLKPSQRKILYTLFKIGGKGELNVGELFGYVKAYSEYHHGPSSLEQGIVNMAQDYVGSNNISLLEPLGSFGTRLSGGKDAAAARYIYTKLKDITKSFFISSDNDILKYKKEDSKFVEPFFYVPIIPNVLLNGTEGIGTGWSTSIPHYKIEDLMVYIVNKITDKRKNIELHPYYEGFKGDIYYDESTDNYITTGVIKRTNMSTLTITELPIGIWNDNYYLLLDKLIDDKVIRTYTKNCTDVDVDIEIKMARENLTELTDDDLYRIFELTSRLNMSNMHLFDRYGKIKKYNNPYEIIDDYYDVRLDYYDKRKEFILKKFNDKKLVYDNIIKFIKLVMNGKIVINNTSMDTIISNLEKNNFDKIDDSYQYLLGISVYKFSKDELLKLKNDYTNLTEQIKELELKDNKKLWMDDLMELKKEVKKLRNNI